MDGVGNAPLLVVTDASWKGVAAVADYDLDLAFGSDEQDFECSFAEPELAGGEHVAVEGTELGGVVDEVVRDTDADAVTYKGRTWHGVLAAKVLRPDPGADYLVLSGDANACLAALLSRCGLSATFHARSASSGVTVSRYQFERYTDAYSGAKAMLAASGAVLRMAATPHGVDVWAEKARTIDGVVDSDRMGFSVDAVHRRTNHLVGLGTGELAARAVSDWYADAAGNVSQTQTLFGEDEVAAVYDYSNAEADKLAEETQKKLKDAQGQGSVSYDAHDLGDAHVGDLVTARDNRTGRTVTAPVSKVVAKVTGGVLTTSYEVGGKDERASSLTGSAESSGAGGRVYTAGRGISIASGVVSAEVAASDLAQVEAGVEDARKAASDADAKVGAAQQAAEKAQATADSKQDRLTAGANVTIAGSTVSATGAVASVNGKSGAVTLSASDVGALDEGGKARSAVKADRLSASHQVVVSGDVSGSTTWDGSGPLRLTLTGQASSGGDAGFLAAHPVGEWIVADDALDPRAYGGTWEKREGLLGLPTMWHRTR